MKMSVLIALILFSPLINAGNKWEVQLPGGGMRFKGELIAEACSIDSSFRDLIVNMGQLRSNMLIAPGQDSSPVFFDILLRDCSKAVSEYVMIQFFGISDHINPNIISISPDDVHVASGIGLAIFDSNEELIPINSPPKRIDKITNGDMRLHFVAKYRATSYNITGGKANAHALFSLTYE